MFDAIHSRDSTFSEKAKTRIDETSNLCFHINRSNERNKVQIILSRIIHTIEEIDIYSKWDLKGKRKKRRSRR